MIQSCHDLPSLLTFFPNQSHEAILRGRRVCQVQRTLELEGKLLAKIDTKIPPIFECTSLCDMILKNLPQEGEVYCPTLNMG